MEYEPLDAQARAGRPLDGDYELVSRGPDGLSGTADDIVMRHNVVDAGLDGGLEDAEPEEESSGDASSGSRERREGGSSPGNRALEAARGVRSRRAAPDQAGEE
jgi:hypothetical protein